MGDAAGDDAQRLVGPVGIGVESARFGFLLQPGVLFEQRFVAHARIGRHQHPLAFVLRFGAVQGVLFAYVGHFDHGARMGHAGRQAHQRRDAVALRQPERLLHHVVGFLLGRGLEDRHSGEFAVEARILLVLWRVHRGIVGRHDDQTAVGSRHGRVDERVGRDVHPYVLHADQRPLSGERHAQGFLHGGFFVGRPRAVDAALRGERMELDVFGDFGRGGARVGVHARQTCVEGSQRESFVSE